MKHLMIGIAASALLLAGCEPAADSTATAESGDNRLRNKEIARDFYENLWFSQNTDRYVDYVADEYVVHDIGDRKNVTEPGQEQQAIADRFHSLGNMTGRISYQIAEGDMVATRWLLSLEVGPQGEAMGMTSFTDIPIINVFRFNDEGKIVEIWNHRHDVDLPRPDGPPPGEGEA